MRKNTKNKKRHNTNKKMHNNALLRGQLMFGKGPSLELHRAKINASPSELLHIAKIVLSDKASSKKIHGPPFPRETAEISSVPVLYKSSGQINEIIWAAYRCIPFAQEISNFLAQREQFEFGVLKDQIQLSQSSLDQIETSFGTSIWLMEARLCVAYNWGGLSGLDTTFAEIDQSLNTQSIIRPLLGFIKTRVESTQELAQQRENLEEAFANLDYVELKEYFDARIFGLFAGGQSIKIASLLFFQANASVIDLYESLIVSLQATASIDELPDFVLNPLAKPITQLYQVTQDRRLLPILRALGVLISDAYTINHPRAHCIEEYTKENYAISYEIAKSILDSNPEDMSIFVLLHKCASKIALAPLGAPGILGKVSKSFQQLYASGNGTYSAVHEILKIAYRFSILDWTAYIKYAVFHEIRQESAEFPQIFSRDMYVRDIHCSPFSAIASAPEARKKIIENPAINEAYPYTLAVYLAAYSGKEPKANLKIGHKASKYLGYYHLAHGDAAIALSTFTDLVSHLTGIDKIRCVSCIALSHLRLSNLTDAAESLLSAYMDNQNVPISLPISHVVTALDSLGSVDNWPTTIAIPIILELYYEYESTDKLANLRIAFENFQIRNSITTPEQLLALDINQKWAQIYLEKVWRPEIMRQTILYQSSKEIEEARIKVCQSLVYLDLDSKSKYLEEIKDRVKRLEIAKGIKLVEQSKVYVDIPAIKKQIIKKLENPYKHYKSNELADFQASSTAARFIESISKSIPDEEIERVFSGLHLYSNAKVTESDVQFHALYSEIRNDFLFGAHGLNAFLSTRVRHGVLSNTLRKPVEDYKLVTAKNENGGEYKKNTTWLVQNNVASSVQSIIDAALEDFSREFDSILDLLKDDYLQVRIEDRVMDNELNKALFTYRSTNIERMILQSKGRNEKELEHFVDRCVDNLWAKTDVILREVQEKIETEIRDKLHSAFDELIAKIKPYSHHSMVQNLSNNISFAWTSTQTKLNTVVSWFKRSEVYDRHDYDLDFPVEVAHNMIRNTISYASDWTDLNICVDDNSVQMPGRTLDAMVYVFYGLIENAIIRSEMPIGNLRVDVKVSLNNTRFYALISNNINLESIDSDKVDKIDNIRREIGSEESHALAQREGLSGLHKVWIAANGPFYSDPTINFGIGDGTFFVELAFTVARETS